MPLTPRTGQRVAFGERHDCSEDYYHSQKPDPFSDAVWDPQKEAVMEKAVRAKLAAAPELADLLRATGSHPLLSLKGDAVWGWCPRKKRGQNLLAKIWMRVRAELLQPTGNEAQHEAVARVTYLVTEVGESEPVVVLASGSSAHVLQLIAEAHGVTGETLFEVNDDIGALSVTF